MNDVAKYDAQTGELMSESLGSFETENIPLAVKLAKVELDQAISTAKAYPRSLTRVRDGVTALVMLDEETAKECVYALPRGGKPIKGPSVRFAEIVASQYGNCKVGSRVVDVNRFEKFVEAEGVFIDLETGMQRTARIRRKISDRSGRVYNDDMIVVTGNAACAIALREAILKGVPKALWRRAYDDAEGVIAGDIKTLAERRDNAIKAFATWGVTADQIFACLEVGGMDEIGLDQIATLIAMYKGIKAGEQQVEEFFPAKAKAADAVEAAKGTAGKLSQIAESAKATTKPEEQARKPDEQGGKSEEQAEKSEGSARGATGKAKKADKPAEGETNGEPEATAASKGASQPEPGTEGGDAEAGDTDAGQAAADDAVEADPADVEKAYGRGLRAGGRGQRDDSMPPDVKKHPALKAAWLRGLAEGQKDQS